MEHLNLLKGHPWEHARFTTSKCSPKTALLGHIDPFQWQSLDRAHCRKPRFPAETAPIHLNLSKAKSLDRGKS